MMNRKLSVAMLVILLVVCASFVVYSLCPGGRSIFQNCSCIWMAMFLGTLSLGVALVGEILLPSKKRRSSAIRKRQFPQCNSTKTPELSNIRRNVKQSPTKGHPAKCDT
jgi:hypothetical protein